MKMISICNIYLIYRGLSLDIPNRLQKSRMNLFCNSIHRSGDKRSLYGDTDKRVENAKAHINRFISNKLIVRGTYINV